MQFSLNTFIFSHSPPKYEDVVHHKSLDLTVPNSNACSIQNGISVHNATSVPPQSCVCHRPISNYEVVRSERGQCSSQENNHSNATHNLLCAPSTSTQDQRGNRSTPSPSCHGCAGTHISHELPLIESVTKLHVVDGQSPRGAGLSKTYGEEDLDDEMEPPPSYSELFEKPSQASD